MKKSAPKLSPNNLRIWSQRSRQLRLLHKCWKLYGPSVNSGCVMQEGSMEDEEGLGEILQRLQAQQDGSNSSNNSQDDDKQKFHLPIKEPQTAPILATTTDIATTQTPAAATIVAARTETQNAATAAQGDAAATTTDSPIAVTAAQASTAERTPEFIDQSTPPPRGSQKRSAQPSSKSKQRKKLRKDAQSRKGAQVKMTRNTLYHVLQDDAQKESTKRYGNHHNFFGTITSGSGKQGYMMICQWVTKKFLSCEET
jgi:hypothetical protein